MPIEHGHELAISPLVCGVAILDGQIGLELIAHRKVIRTPEGRAPVDSCALLSAQNKGTLEESNANEDGCKL